MGEEHKPGEKPDSQPDKKCDGKDTLDGLVKEARKRKDELAASLAQQAGAEQAATEYEAAAADLPGVVSEYTSNWKGDPEAEPPRPSIPKQIAAINKFIADELCKLDCFKDLPKSEIKKIFDAEHSKVSKTKSEVEDKEGEICASEGEAKCNAQTAQRRYDELKVLGANLSKAIGDCNDLREKVSAAGAKPKQIYVYLLEVEALVKDELNDDKALKPASFEAKLVQAFYDLVDCKRILREQEDKLAEAKRLLQIATADLAVLLTGLLESILDQVDNPKATSSALSSQTASPPAAA